MAILSNTEFGILRLTISRAHKRNSINAEMFDTMTEALAQAAADDAVRVVLLQGGEQIFSAGADLDEMRASPDLLDRAMTNFFAALRHIPQACCCSSDGALRWRRTLDVALLRSGLRLRSCTVLPALRCLGTNGPFRFRLHHDRRCRPAPRNRKAHAPPSRSPLPKRSTCASSPALPMTKRSTILSPPKSHGSQYCLLMPCQAMKALLTHPRNKALESHIEEEEAVWRRQARSSEAAEALAAFLEGRSLPSGPRIDFSIISHHSAHQNGARFFLVRAAMTSLRTLCLRPSCPSRRIPAPPP